VLLVKTKPTDALTNSWLPTQQEEESEPKPSSDNSWKEFLEQALQRIEKAKDPNTTSTQKQPEYKQLSSTSTSMLGPPRQLNNAPSGGFRPKTDFKPKFTPQKPNQMSASSNQYNQFNDKQKPNKPPFNNYRQQHNQPRYENSNAGRKPPSQSAKPLFPPSHVNKLSPQNYPSPQVSFSLTTDF
jgi:hypothetical protein